MPPPIIPKVRAVTIEDSFDRPLPYIPSKEGLGARTHDSSAKAKDQTPPKLWLHRGIANYITLANKALASTRRMRQATMENCIPAMEEFEFHTEGDVERASFLYLLNGVNVALAALYPRDKIRCLCQPQTRPRSNRPDVIYKKNGITFAVLEHKVVGTIVKEEFTDAQLPMESPPALIRANLEIAAGETDGTFFHNNALSVVKQLTLYAENPLLITNYVASFNWDYMFLAIFNRNRRNEAIHGTLVSRADNDGRALRRALFGWLVEACENGGRNPLAT